MPLTTKFANPVDVNTFISHLSTATPEEREMVKDVIAEQIKRFVMADRHRNAAHQMIDILLRNRTKVPEGGTLTFTYNVECDVALVDAMLAVFKKRRKKRAAH